MGTPLALSEAARLTAFQAGWAHEYKEQASPGYYIGRPHPPFTECRVVKSIESSSSDFLVDCELGEPCARDVVVVIVVVIVVVVVAAVFLVVVLSRALSSVAPPPPGLRTPLP